MNAINMNNWWVEFFNNDFAETVLTVNEDTVAKSAVLINSVLNGCKDKKIMDQCCGIGLLTEYLTTKYQADTLGIDISKRLIDSAKERIKKSELNNISFLNGDAKYNYDAFNNQFDAVINWHTSFAYDTSDDENCKMLKTMSSYLKSNGKFIINTINPFAIWNNFQRYFVNDIVDNDGKHTTIIRENFLEDDNKLTRSEWTVIYPDGSRKYACGQTKLYTLLEMQFMLQNVGLQVDKVFGDLDMNVYRNRKDIVSPRMIICGHKV